MRNTSGRYGHILLLFLFIKLDHLKVIGLPTSLQITELIRHLRIRPHKLDKVKWSDFLLFLLLLVFLFLATNAISKLGLLLADGLLVADGLASAHFTEAPGFGGLHDVD